MSPEVGRDRGSVHGALMIEISAARPRQLLGGSRLCAKIALSQSSRSVFVQASTSARKPILVESPTMRSAASVGVSKALLEQDSNPSVPRLW
jgi:hypothetical protein